MSAGVEGLIGIKVEDVMRDVTLFFNQIPADQMRIFDVTAEKAISENTMFDLEFEAQLPDGRLRWMHLVTAPHRLSDGHVVWNGIQTDITERRKAEEVWRHMSAIVESSHDAIMGMTLDGTVTSWNPAAERLYGYSAAEMLGQSIWLLLPPDYPNDIADILRKVANRGHVADYETIRRRKDGSLVDVSLRTSPILDASGNVTGASAIAHDITERKVAREALLRSEKLAATGRLAATIAHEINNPLAAAMNAVYVAGITPDLPAQAGEMLGLAERELRRAAHITRQTLGFYRDSGNQQQVTAHDVVKEVLSVYQAKLHNRNVTVEYRHRCGPNAPRGGCPEDCKQCQKYLCVNAGELRQVISNLLANGIDAISEGGTMHIRVSRFTDRVQLTIADNGFGIRTENLKRIFEPFFTTKEAYGTGLGLWVTQELVRKHNGSIKVRSRKNKGTVFHMTFPQVREEDGSVVTAPSTSLPKVA
jgi:PAS domain S-box-containing protein